MIAHGIVGLSIVALAPWKARSRDGVSSAVVPGGTAIAFAAHRDVDGGGPRSRYGVVIGRDLSPLGCVATAVAAVAVGVAHVVQRPVRARATDLSRRSLLGVEPSWAPGQPVGWFDGVLRVAGVRGLRRDTGSFETGSASADMVTQWFNDQLRDVDEASWRLRVSDGARTYSVDDLAVFDDVMHATLDCTGGWYAEQVARRSS